MSTSNLSTLIPKMKLCEGVLEIQKDEALIVTCGFEDRSLAFEEVSDRVKRAGYRAAFTGSARAVGPRSNKFLLSRWEPALLESDRFLASVALRLNLSDGVPLE